MIYRYEAYNNKEGKTVRGTIEGASEELAEGILYRAGYDRIISLKGTDQAFDWRKLVLGSPKVSQQALLDFTNELAIMIEAGLSLQNALGQLEKQSTERSMKTVLAKLAADLRAGTPMHTALSAHPQIFSQTYISMIEANEKSGTLEDGLQQIAKGLKQDVETKGKIQQALIQPAIVVALAIGVIFIMMTFVLPKLTGVFTQFGAQLPATTRLLMNFSTFVSVNKYYILLAIVVLIFLAIVLIRRPAGRRYLDNLILKLPLVGQVVIWENTARFSRTAANLLKGRCALAGRHEYH